MHCAWVASGYQKPMKQAEIFPKNADNCSQLAEAAKGPLNLRYKRMEEAWRALATEQDWLDGRIPAEPIGPEVASG
jgi:hypothetical protein